MSEQQQREEGWVRVSPSVNRHPRVAPVGAWGAVVIKAAWEMVVAFKTGGVLAPRYWTPHQLAEWTMFNRVRGGLARMKRGMEACEKHGLVERQADGSVIIHDWDQYYEYAAAVQPRKSSEAGSSSSRSSKGTDKKKTQEDVGRVKERRRGGCGGGGGEPLGNPSHVTGPHGLDLDEVTESGTYPRGPNKGKPRRVKRYTGGGDELWFDWMTGKLVPRETLGQLGREWMERYPEVDVRAVVRRVELWMRQRPYRARRRQKLAAWIERVFILPEAEKMGATRKRPVSRHLDERTEQMKGRSHGDWDGIVNR